MLVGKLRRGPDVETSGSRRKLIVPNNEDQRWRQSLVTISPQTATDRILWPQYAAQLLRPMSWENQAVGGARKKNIQTWPISLWRVATTSGRC